MHFRQLKQFNPAATINDTRRKAIPYVCYVTHKTLFNSVITHVCPFNLNGWLQHSYFQYHFKQETTLTHRTVYCTVLPVVNETPLSEARQYV